MLAKSHGDKQFRTKANFYNNLRGHKNVKETCRTSIFAFLKLCLAQEFVPIFF